MSSSSSNISTTGIGAVLAAGKPKQKPPGRGKNFHHRYLALCRASNFKPIAEIANPKRKGNTAYTLLDVYCDRFTSNDWLLIAKALSEDRSLQWMSLRLRKACTEGVNQDGNGQPADSNKQTPHRPVICEKRLLKLLIENLCGLLKTNQKLESFTLEGFPLDGVWTSSLALGLKNNSSLTELNLARSAIGDEGCEAICRELKYRPNLLTINLSACRLTERACLALADAIRFQKIQRYESSWEMSLRYGDFKEERLFGVRCLSLSHNPAIGDGGLLALTEVLKDDAWVRQVHLCNCGLTDAGAQMLLECLNLNATIEQFDIRENMDISSATCREILMKLGATDGDFGDGLESAARPQKKNGNTAASLRELLEHCKAQLESALERNSQLESTVAQLHLRLGDNAMLISGLQRQLKMLQDEKEEMSAAAEEEMPPMKPDNRRPVPAVVAARKVQSEMLRPAKPPKGPVYSMSELLVAGTGPARTPASLGHQRIIERTMGDSCCVGAAEDEPEALLCSLKHLDVGNDGAAGDGWEPGELDEPSCVDATQSKLYPARC